MSQEETKVLKLAGSARARRNALILGLVFCCPLLAVCILYSFRKSQIRAFIADPAIYAAQTSPELIEELGEPMTGGKPDGKFVSKRGSGNADLTIPLRGPKGGGLLREWAQQRNGAWHLCSLSFELQDGATRIVVDAAKTHCEPE